jgi:hypothetical protein
VRGDRLQSGVRKQGIVAGICVDGALRQDSARENKEGRQQSGQDHTFVRAYGGSLNTAQKSGKCRQKDLSVAITVFHPACSYQTKAVSGFYLGA